MPRLILRRSEANAASAAEAVTVVAAHQGRVIDRSERMMLVEDVSSGAASAIRSALPGWLVSEQSPVKIPVPDTRLKVRAGR